MIRNGSLAWLFCLSFLVQMGCAQEHGPVNVRSLGAIADGKSKDTAAFQKALDDCAAAGGGEVLVPAGNYLIGSIELKSNTTLHLDQGANVTGSPDLADYPIVKARWEGVWVDAHRGLIFAKDANHIAIVGPGHITGDPKIGGRQMPRRPCVIETIQCNDVRFDGFSAQQTRMWTIHPTCCQNVVATNLNIRSKTGNGDGIDVDSCQHVRIENCDIDTGDDCIALKSGRGMEAYRAALATEDVQISGCTLGDSIFACIGIGSETSGGIRNVRIDHCTFTHSKTYSIYIKSNLGRGASIDDISASDLVVQSATRGFLRINLTSSGIKGSDPVLGNDGIPSGKNYRFTNVKLSKCGALIDGSRISSVKPLDGLIVENVTGECQKGIELAYMTNVVLSGIEIVPHKGPLLSIWHVTGSGLKDAAKFIPTTQRDATEPSASEPSP